MTTEPKQFFVSPKLLELENKPLKKLKRLLETLKP